MIPPPHRFHPSNILPHPNLLVSPCAQWCLLTFPALGSFPKLLRNPPCRVFSTCKPRVSVLIQMTQSSRHQQQEHNGRRILPIPGLQGTQQLTAVMNMGHLHLLHTNGCNAFHKVNFVIQTVEGQLFPLKICF